MTKKKAKAPPAAVRPKPSAHRDNDPRAGARNKVAIEAAQRADREAGVHDRTGGKGIKVRATRLGYYDNERKRIGDVFIIGGPKEFSTEWMETVDGSTPVKTTGPQTALNRETHRIAQEKAGTGPGQGADEASAQGGSSPLGD